ncbi:MAG: hypothetical protein IM526_02365 [Microcystis sp. M38BS1]|uniref:hypothetical protein n=1 Tax=Microcystis sp. M38BS1 TaxID=2771188 RepID=UPI0031FC6BC7|nr:hypothetical protein [Microcystis sp. M38BS1]MCA6582500.1 hypothetical protein [Pseudanabaena sp. M34BS1SP1A06MG]
MARLTGKNDIYLPCKSTEEIVREAVEAHEARFTKNGWELAKVIIPIAFLVLLVNDIILVKVL